MSSNKRSSAVDKCAAHKCRAYKTAVGTLSYMLTSFFVLVALVVCQSTLWPKQNTTPLTPDEVEKMFSVVKTDKLVWIKYFIKKDKRLAKATDENGNTLLMAALEADREKRVIKYLMRISDVDAVNNNGESAVAFACRYCSKKSIIKKILSDCKTPPDNIRARLLRADSNGITPYERSLENTSPVARDYATHVLHKKDITRFLTSVTARANEQDDTADSTVQDYIAVYAPEPDDSINGTPADEPIDTPIDSNSSGDSGTVVPIVPVIPSPNTADSTSTSPSRKSPLIDDFTSYPADSYSPSYLYDYADTQQNIDAPFVTDSTQNNSLTAAAINERDQNGVTRLMTAAKKGSGWEVSALIKSGANVLDADNDGWTALMYAVRYQVNNSIVTALLDAGSNVYQENSYGFTALTIAARYNENPAITESLVRKFKATDDEVFRALIVTITAASPEEVRLAKMNAFLERGVIINRYWEGKTPLMYAAQSCRSTGPISVLIKSGAVTSMISADGKKAFDYANENNLLPHDDVYWSLNSK